MKVLSIVTFSNSTLRKFTKSYFQKLLVGVDACLGKQLGDIGVHFVTAAGIQKLNWLHRGKNKPTDVLSFAYHETGRFPGEELFGELFLCPVVIAKNAPLSNNTFEQELRFIFIHGMLHLLGYDHRTDEEERRMNSLTEGILNLY